GPRVRAYPRIDLLATPLGRWIASPSLALAVELLALAAFIVTVVAGVCGGPNSLPKISPTLVGGIRGGGVAYVSAFVANIWTLINPWRTIFEAIETTIQGLTGRHTLGLRLVYLEVLGVWPVFFLLLAFACIELVYPNPAVPRTIVWLALAYSLLTFAGMFLFGRERW